MICSKQYRYLLISSILCMPAACLQAQDMTTPYSVFGIGIIDHNMYNRTSGLGHTGLGLKSANFLINNNPASIASLDKSFYIFDIGASGQSVKFAGDPINENNNSSRDFGVKRVSFAVKLTDHWASSAGFRQYSSVNYKYAGSVPVEGSSKKYVTAYEGDGGLGNFYWTNAFSIGKHLQAGVTMNIINGSINKTELLTDEALSTAIETRQQDYYSRLRLEYGLLYSGSFSKKWQFTLGGRLANKASMTPERTLTVTRNSTVITDEALLESEPFHLPLSYGAGISITNNNKVTFAADYISEQWSALDIKGSGWSLLNSHRFSGGIEISQKVEVWNRPVERRFYQLGGFVNNSYLSVNNHQITDYGVTAGFGGSWQRLLYHMSLEIGQRGTINDGLIKENYFRFTLSLSYRDFLFSKGRKYD